VDHEDQGRSDSSAAIERDGLLRGAAGRLRGCLERTLSATSVPYGYTVTIWVCGAYLIRRQGDGTPGLGVMEGLAFVTGALLGFAVLAALAGRFVPHAAPEGEALDEDIRHPLFAAGFHVLAIGLALLAGMLAARWLGDAAWFLTPFLATSIYLAAASAELALALELSRRESRLAHGVKPRPRPIAPRPVERGGPPPP
jgi:hypothetical protein